MNVIWAVTIGWILALQAFVTGLLLCFTIIGIPFGISCFQLAFLCFRPFGVSFSAEEEVQVITTTTTTGEEGGPVSSVDTYYRTIP